MKRYGTYEQINGGVANGLMDEIDEQRKVLKNALDALDHAGLQDSIAKHDEVMDARAEIRELLLRE